MNDKFPRIETLEVALLIDDLIFNYHNENPGSTTRRDLCRSIDKLIDKAVSEAVARAVRTTLDHLNGTEP